MRVSGSAVQDTGGESEIHSAVTGEGGGWGGPAHRIKKTQLFTIRGLLCLKK